MTAIDPVAESAAAEVPPPVKYGNFNFRMIASSLDTALLFMFALPAVDFMVSNMFQPVDMDRITALMQAAGAQADLSNTLASFWQAAREQHLIERIVVENALQVGFVALYLLPFWFRYSSSPGKMLFRLQIVDEKSGLPMTERQAIIRFLGYFVSTIPLSLGFVWILFNKKRRGFHDMIAGTVVIVKPRKPPPA